MTGLQIYNKAKPHVGEAYLLGTLVPKDDANWRGAWDCAELAIWSAYQVAGKLYGCYNNNGKPHTADAYTGYLARDAESLGVKISVEQAARTPGALVLRVAANGVTGHVVISDGHGGTVEAHSHADGVILGKLAARRWDYGILLPWITYEENQEVAVPKPAKAVYYLASPMMRGPVVLEIEKALKQRGYYHGALDGIFGGGLFAAVRSYQGVNGLNVDGEVGEKTAGLLGIAL